MLPSSLVAGTLMLAAVLALLALSDTANRLSHGHRLREQRQAWLEAAFLLYERDSTLMERLDGRDALVLFGDDPRSEVVIRREMWGLYEIVKAATDGGKVRRARLMGLADESPARAALYVPDNRMAFTLAGKSGLRGRAYLPGAELLYGQVQGEFYTGERLPPEDIRPAEEYFPALDGAVPDSLRSLITMAAEALPADEAELRVGFFEPTRILRAENLAGMTLHGNIVVSSPGGIAVDSTSRLENVILIAPEVTVGEGFSGTVQIVASDSVRIARGARLKYPSGIVIPQGAAESFIEVASGAEVNGYVVFRSTREPPDERRTPQYLQHGESRVRGLVWVEGIAQIQGGVTGSLYVGQSNHYTPQGYYRNVLYHTTLIPSRAMPFPRWMTGVTQRRTAKWLD